MRMLICPDSYKGSASADVVARSISDGISSVIPYAEIIRLPIADGGEGSMYIVAQALSAEIVEACVTGPYGESVRARYALKGERAYIEMAEASGLCLSRRRDVENASTYGTGELILDAAGRGAREIVVFIGGRATNDGGMGAAAALGYEFYAESGERLEPVGRNMSRVCNIAKPSCDVLSDVCVICATDVDNVMYGERGAAFVFARQKGADDATVLELDEGLKNLASVIERELCVDVHTLAGGGAAGGLGAGLYAFARARMNGGFSLICRTLSLEQKIRESDVIITGEGCTDYQSVMGKGVGRILELCRKHGKKCIVISGLVRDTEALAESGIYRAYEASSYAPSVEESIKNAEKYITLAASDAAEKLQL